MPDTALRDLLETESRRVTLEPGAAERMFERRHRAVRRRRSATAVVGLGLAAGVAALILLWLPTSSRDRNVVTGPSAVAGTYVTRLTEGDPTVVRLGLAGRYELRLDESGSLSILSPIDVGLPGPPIRFDVDGRSLTTDLLVGRGCDAPGTYRWMLDDGRLALAPVEEACELRSTILATETWRTVAATPPVDEVQGEWRASFPCEDQAAAVEASAASRHDQAFWRRANAEQLGSPDPDDPCAGGGITRSYTLRFAGDRLQIFDDGPDEGFDGRYLLEGDILTIRDPSTRNISGAYRLRVEIGDRSLAFTLLDRGATDPWFVATWQVAPFARIG